MGRYTISKDPRADAAVQDSLNLIVRNILELMNGNIDAIVLVGGFGRGEGGVILENGRFRPVNDFDIVVIVSKGYVRIRKRYARQLQELSKKLAPLCGVKQIDIGISHPLRFRFAPNLVESYEVRNGYRVLWGDVNLKQLMPSLPAAKLPLLDGAIYFLSRGSGLLIPALYFLPDGKVLPKYRENFQIEIDKACMAMGDALLLLKKSYHFSYMMRLRRLEKMDMSYVPEGETIKTWYIDAVERKLQPQFSWSGDKIMVRQWFSVRDVFSKFFLWFEGIRLGRPFKNWTEYSIFVVKHVRDPFRDRLRRWVRIGLRSGLFSYLRKDGWNILWRHSRAFKWATMPMVLFSLENGGINRDQMNRARTLLGLPPAEGSIESWCETAKEYLKLFHPQGIVAELVREERT